MSWKYESQYQADRGSDRNVRDYERDQYRSDQYRQGSDRLHGSQRDAERGFFDRAGDEVKSWMGDQQAEQRRNADHSEYGNSQSRSSGSRYPGSSSRMGGSGQHFEQMRVHEVMTHNVAAVHPQDSATRAARLMAECDCGALPVVSDNGRLIGMITDRDITVRIAARGLDPRQARVEDGMTPEAYACHAEDRLVDCMDNMSRHQIRRMPIVDDQRRLVGIVSQGDLARQADEPGERRRFTEVVSSVSQPSRGSYR
jgi:CBS domain-containing protein